MILIYNNIGPFTLVKVIRCHTRIYIYIYLYSQIYRSDNIYIFTSTTHTDRGVHKGDVLYIHNEDVLHMLTHEHYLIHSSPLFPLALPERELLCSLTCN
jgi:hypothetical protein